MSMPVSGPPRRCPLDGLIVPMSTGVLLPEPVKAVPAWQPAQSSVWNSVRPCDAADDKAPADGLNGLLSNVASEPT